MRNTGLNVNIQNYLAISVPLIRDSSGVFLDGRNLPEEYKEELKPSSRILVSYGPRSHHSSEKISVKLDATRLLDVYNNKEKLMVQANKNIGSLIEEHDFLENISDGCYRDDFIKHAFVINTDSLAKI